MRFDLSNYSREKMWVFLIVAPLLVLFQEANAFNAVHSLTKLSTVRTLPLLRMQMRNDNSDGTTTGADTDNAYTNDEAGNHDNYSLQKTDSVRRSLLFSSLSLSASALLLKPLPSHANLVQFPCSYDLMNTYHFMRAGESLLESQDTLSTNPLFLTNRGDKLSNAGIEQVEAACNDMMLNNVNPSVLKYSLAAKSIDTSNIIATKMLVGRNRLIPEYTFMDPRGIGLWDMQQASTLEDAIWAMDHDESGPEGVGGRPPPNDDGTPNETLSEQVIRLRQLMSVLETQFSGDTILLVFGDGTSPALLSCLIAGIPLNRVHEFNFAPGEVRYDMKMETILSNNSVRLAAAAEDAATASSAEYMAKIQRGRDILKNARADLSQFREKDLGEKPNYYTPMIKTTKAKTPPPPQKQAKSKSVPVSSKAKMDKKYVEQTKGSENTSRSNMMALLGLGVIAASTFSQVSSSDETTIENTNTFDEDEKGMEVVESVPTIAKNEAIDQTPELQRMEHLIATAPIPIQIPENVPTVPTPAKNETIGGQTQTPASVGLQRLENLAVSAPFDIPEMRDDKQRVKEKVARADEAMEEYMNKDDGGDDWLNLMNSLMDDVKEEE